MNGSVPIEDHEKLMRAAQELAFANQVARNLMGVVELEDCMGLVAEMILDQMRCDECVVALYEASQGEIGLLMEARAKTDIGSLIWLREPIRHGVMHAAIQDRKALLLAEIGEVCGLHQWEMYHWREGGQVAVIPIYKKECPIAVVALHKSPDDEPFTPAYVSHINAQADLIAGSLYTAKVYHKQRCQVYASLERVVLGNEQRISYLCGHSERVLAYAMPIAENLNLTSTQVGALQIASRLCDIGLVSVPHELIDHSDALAPECRTIYERHPLIGQYLLAPLDFFGEVGNILKAHHENYDNTGFPDNLAGEEIPLVARVIAVADVLDALTSPRPYREGVYPLDRALQTIQEHAGGMFDPDVVRALMASNHLRLAEIQSTHRA